MKILKRVYALLLAVACALFLFAACSDTGGTDAGKGENGTQTETPDEGGNTGGGNTGGGQTDDEPVYSVSFGKTTYSLLLDDDSLSSLALGATAYTDGKADTGARIGFSTADASVAEVSADGILTAKAHGKTTVTASYQGASATAEVLVYGSATKRQVNSFDEEYIRRFGRQYITNNGLNADHVASGVEVTFYGTQLTAEIFASAAIYVTVFIDGGEGAFTQLSAGWSTNTLAADLEQGIHTVRVLKSSEIYDGQLVFSSFDAEQFLKPQKAPQLKIEFVGDSLTTGYGALGNSGDSRTVQNSDACSSFAYLTAQELGADHSCVAIQGICVKAYHWQTSRNMTEMYTYVSPMNTQPYEYEQDIDVIVLNLGTNDASYITTKDASYARQFPADYKDFLSLLRSKHEDAYIVCTYGMMGANTHIVNGISQAIEQLGDEKIVYFPSPVENRSGANGHPNKAAHVEMAEELSRFIRTLDI